MCLRCLQDIACISCDLIWSRLLNTMRESLRLPVNQANINGRSNDDAMGDAALLEKGACWGEVT